ncbi:MAG: hypothetical protein JXA18_12125 [Chitinispirillaceae bacterium]|nr:hypothetical protein [Chitinispirillaceae bacterium]
MKQSFRPLAVAMFLSCLTVSLPAGPRGGIRFPIDGYNVFGAADSMIRFDRGFSFTAGEPDDSFHTVPSIDDSLRRAFHARCFLGAETGDPLLNGFTSSAPHPNRDHETRASVSCAGRKIPLTAVMRYRYIDTYSDRFDSIWARYEEITGRGMENSNRGLVDEAFAAAAYRWRTVRLSASIDRREGWHATPYFFSPIYEKELTVSPLLHYVNGPVRITSRGAYRKSSWYFDHEHPVDYNDPSLNTEAAVAPAGRLSGSLTLSYDAAVQPAASIRGGWYYKDSLINAGVHGSVFSNLHSAADAYGTLRLGRQWRCSLAVARDYCPKERSSFFLEYDTVVMYEPRSIERNVLFSTIDWKAPVRCPAGISGWFFYNSRPRRESVSSRNDTLFISQAVDGGSTRSFMGLKGFLDIKRRFWSLSAVPAMMIPLGKKENVHFFVGKTAVLALTGTTAGLTPASATIGLACSDRPTLNYLMSLPPAEPQVRTFTAPAFASLHVSCRIPFVVPFFPATAKTGLFSVEAGPINCTGHLRQKVHPRGNLMGPEIYAGFEWFIP